MSTYHLGPLNLDAFKRGPEAGLASVAEQLGGRRVELPAQLVSRPGDAAVVADTLAAMHAINRIADEARLTVDARLHYLRCVRANLANAEDRLADDDLPPCIAEKFADIAADIHHAAANPED